MRYKVDKQKCTGCGVCMRECPGATKIGEDGKSAVIDEERLERCGGAAICPFGAIINEEGGESPSTPAQQQFIGQRRGRGLGRGRGRGLGIGPRDGRGKGRGGGGRRRRR